MSDTANTPDPSSPAVPQAAAVTDDTPDTDVRAAPDEGANASGNQSDSAVTWDVVDSGQSEDIESSLTGQGTSDRETVADINRAERELWARHRAADAGGDTADV